MESIKAQIEGLFPTKNDAYIKLDDSLCKKLTGIEDDQKISLFNVIVQFAHYFDLFRDVQYFFEEVYDAIVGSIELIDEDDGINSEEFDQLLQKTILLRFIDAYVTYAKLDQKEKILDILSTSLGVLAPQALFLNLGLLVKPVYSSEDFVKEKRKQEVVEISYEEYQVGGEAEAAVKQGIDSWIHTQTLDLEKQADLKAAMHEEFDQLCQVHGIPQTSSNYESLWAQVNEMLVMQLTIVSLGGFADEDDEDLAPVPLSP